MSRSIGQVTGLAANTAAALLVRPRLWTTALRQAALLAPLRWWASSPRLPVPPADYLHFRQVTLSGDATALPAVSDVVTWLEWCRSMRRLARDR